MRLSTFIHDTLYEIALGINIGRARALEMVAIMPGTIDGVDVQEKTYVDFDIAVVVDENSTNVKTMDGSGGAKIQVASLVKLETKGELKTEIIDKTSQEKTHRITFKIPMYMNAHFKENKKAIAEASKILEEYGFITKS